MTGSDFQMVSCSGLDCKNGVCTGSDCTPEDRDECEVKEANICTEYISSTILPRYAIDMRNKLLNTHLQYTNNSPRPSICWHRFVDD